MYCQEVRMNNVANKVAYVTTILGSNIFVVDFMVQKSGYGTKHMRFIIVVHCWLYHFVVVPMRRFYLCTALDWLFFTLASFRIL